MTFKMLGTKWCVKLVIFRHSSEKSEDAAYWNRRRKNIHWNFDFRKCEKCFAKCLEPNCECLIVMVRSPLLWLRVQGRPPGRFGSRFQIWESQTPKWEIWRLCIFKLLQEKYTFSVDSQTLISESMNSHELQNASKQIVKVWLSWCEALSSVFGFRGALRVVLDRGVKFWNFRHSNEKSEGSVYSNGCRKNIHFSLTTKVWFQKVWDHMSCKMLGTKLWMSDCPGDRIWKEVRGECFAPHLTLKAWRVSATSFSLRDPHDSRETDQTKIDTPYSDS